MRIVGCRTFVIALHSVCLLYGANSGAQSNSPALKVSAYACRAPDITSPASRGVPEFRVTVLVTNNGAGDVFFQNVEGAFGPATGGALRSTITGPKESMTLKAGAGKLFNFHTDGWTPH